jgi:hypothetical protein
MSVLRNQQEVHPLITTDPISGKELIVTRLECPESGVVIEGRFALGWIGRLSGDQLDFVELMVKNRGNINSVAGDLKVAYNTARNRLDDIVAALGGQPSDEPRVDRRVVLDRLAAKEISVEDAMRLLRS